MLFLYKILINFTLIISPIIIILRIIKKKEDPKRFFERYSIASEKRKSGKLIWFHGSSVGEILSIIPLIEILERDKNINQILLTSNTLSSSKVFEKLKLKKTIHQFFPIDSEIIINIFLNYWKPSLVVFVESEIWPNTINILNNRRIQKILINARITKKSYNNWRLIKKFSYSLFSKFQSCLSQNNETTNYLKKLGANNIKKIGNLKFSESSFEKKNKISGYKFNYLKSKKILFGAISTHYNEEILFSKVHKKLKKQYNNSVSIIVPRHVNRTDEIKNAIEEEGLRVYLHSSKEKKYNKFDIYLVDTYGEARSFMKICKVVFLGGSLVKHGGQNPLEAARLGCKVIHGPHVNNFTEVYNLLNKIKISSKVKNINQAKLKILKSLNSKFSYSKNIVKLNYLGKKILLKNKEEIKKYF